MSDERRIATTVDAPWLPAGGSAEVWVGNDCHVALPVIVTRLLVVRSNPSGALEFFCVPTPRGPNLPKRYLWGKGAHESSSEGTSRLMEDVFGNLGLANRCIGFIRNVVPTPGDGYTYPSPHAHVPVFLISETASPIISGAWFGLEQGQLELSDRHWWPIVEYWLANKSRNGSSTATSSFLSRETENRNYP